MSFSTILYTVILYPLVQLIEISYKLFDKLFNSTGLSVIGVSLTVTLFCLPLYIVAEKWQQVERDTQKKLKPGIDRIKQTFKGDEQYMILSTFYKQNHYHPMMALRSSFGLLIQVPFFMAAYSCLSSMPALQGQSFLFIRDMGVQDALFKIGNFPVNILPIAMTIINIIAGAIYTKGFAIREKVQIYGMALLFLVILYTSPSGLVLYWTMNNVFSLIKNIFYKFKNPVKVLYICMCTGIAFIDIYIMFIYGGAAGIKKRFIACAALTLLVLIPLFVKGVKWLLNNPLSILTENKKIRHTLFLLSAVSVTIFMGLVIPSSIISSSVQEFSDIGKYNNPNQLLLNPFWQTTGIFILWASCVYFLFGKRIQTIIVLFFSCFLFCGIVNAFAFAGDYGTMDITLKFIDGFINPGLLFSLVNILVDVLIIVVLILIFKFKKQKILTSITLVSIFAFFTIFIINSLSTKKQYNLFSETNKIEQAEDFTKKYNLSSEGKNVIVMMLDRAESSFVEDMFNSSSELNNTFDGFTYYKNTVSYNGHTLIGAPPLYGGYEYTPQMMNRRNTEKLVDKHNQSLMVMPRLFSEEADYKTTISDLSWANYNYFSDLSFVEDNYPDITAHKLQGRYTGDFKKEFSDKLEHTINLETALERNLLFVSIFRTSFVLLRPVIYYKGSWWMNEETTDLDTFINAFSVLYYLNKITQFNSDKENNFILMTNDATHSGEDSSIFGLTPEFAQKETNNYKNMLLCMLSLGNWFKEMKANNCYDNTRIILVADHGIGSGKNVDTDFTTTSLNGYSKDHLHPLLMMKDFNSHGNLNINTDFMTTADTANLALNGIINEPKNPFTKNPINSEEKKNGVYVTTADLSMPDASRSNKIFTVPSASWWHIKENIFVDSNWTQEAPRD